MPRTIQTRSFRASSAASRKNSRERGTKVRKATAIYSVVFLAFVSFRAKNLSSYAMHLLLVHLDLSSKLVKCFEGMQLFLLYFFFTLDKCVCVCVCVVLTHIHILQHCTYYYFNQYTYIYSHFIFTSYRISNIIINF